MVLDTDAYNEVDDQFALVYSLISPEVKVEAVYAAPFHNVKSADPADGMLKSYEEIIRILDLLGVSPDQFVFRGSSRYMGSPETPCESPATEDLIHKARQSSQEDRLYVVAIGAPTNVSSALILAPDIRKNITVVWLGGNARSWPGQNEFNQKQDPAASRILFDREVDLVQVPCWPVASHLQVGIPELRACMGDSEIAGSLTALVEEALSGNMSRTRILWDLSAVAWVVDPGLLRLHWIHSPVLCPGLMYAADESRHLIRCAYHVQRDKLFTDFYQKIRRVGNGLAI